MLSSSHCTGRAPDQARHSSTSRTCSAAWMWIGPAVHRSTSARSSGASTARSECGAMPSTAPSRRSTCRRLASNEPPETIEIEQETRLTRRGRLAAAAAVGIERGQQRQADAARLRRGDDAAAGLGRVGIARPVRCVVQVVELADPGEARLQHLHVGPCRYRLDVVGRHAREEPVHHLAPGPEAVVLRPAPLDETGHGALEGVAVHVGDTRHGDAGEALGTRRWRALSGSIAAMLRPSMLISTSRCHPSPTARAAMDCSMDRGCLVDLCLCRAVVRSRALCIDITERRG